ncbi:DUF3977 family protein [Fictibacillus arsenicus]|uniref:DUF3977 domain-containing protein n=1 Tax=Fictibacillus arsenicus TaxID=255247 RepID=A0A1V3G8I1_9BACL|nr:DUF3977 family protein [Fictibacillus arsenicus]OOE12713.1 hypothetical protein UN64_11670 [Fictibacillus arsenicus]
MKFIEFGFGNRWFVRTETELNNGTEFEEKGIVRPIRLQSLYLRIWIGKTVVILDSKEGYKGANKNCSDFKLLFGIRSL